MNNQEAINILQDMIDYQWGFSDMEKSIGIEALEKGIDALDTCHLMSKGIQYITFGGKIYKLTDEKGE